MIELAAVLIALGLLMYLAYRGVTLILLAPAAVLVAVALSGGLPVLAAYTHIFMTNTGQFVVAFFPLFLLGAAVGARAATGRPISAGVSVAAMHRVTAIASGALDALPHNGAVITLLAVCQLSHREAYLDVFMTSVVGPMIALVIVIALATLLGSF